MKFLSHLQQSQWGKHVCGKNILAEKGARQPPPDIMVYLLMVSCAEALMYVLHEM